MIGGGHFRFKPNFLEISEFYKDLYEEVVAS